MDTELFLERCENIEKGLHKLANEFYKSLDDDSADVDRGDLIVQAKEKVRLFEQLSLDIEDEDEEDEIQTFKRYIKKLKGYILKAEK